MKKEIYVNGTILHETPSGLGVYAKNIIKCMIEKHVPMKVIAPIEIEGAEVIKTTKYVKPSYKKKGGLMRLLYTQFVLPFKVPKDAIIYHPFQYLSLFSRKKQVITIHDFIPLYYKEVAKHQYRYYKYFMPLLLKKAYKIICISQNTKEDLLKFYNVDESKVTVVYNGYDENMFNTKNIKKDVLKKHNISYPYLIAVGAGYSHKNLHRAIEAFSKVKDKGDLKFIITGKESEYIKTLKDLSKKLNIEDKIVFLGYVEDEDLSTLYNKSEAFIYPTLYEGFGLPILEAWACDTIVACSNNSSLKEIVNGGAITFNPESIEEIKNSIEKVIKFKGTEELEKIKNNAKENLKLYSWDKTAEEIYRTIID